MEKKFRLQKVLEFRERRLEQEKLKLAEMYDKKKEYQQKKKLIIEDIDKTTKDLYRLKSKGEFQYLLMYENFIDKCKQMLQSAEEMINKLQENIDVQQGVVTEALNELKIMEKLKEKHAQNYMMYIKKEEMKFIDELVTSRYNGGNNNV